MHCGQVCAGTEKVLDTPELVLYVVVSFLMCWELKSDPLEEQVCSHNYGAISSASNILNEGKR